MKGSGPRHHLAQAPSRTEAGCESRRRSPALKGLGIDVTRTVSRQEVIREARVVRSETASAQGTSVSVHCHQRGSPREGLLQQQGAQARLSPPTRMSHDPLRGSRFTTDGGMPPPPTRHRRTLPIPLAAGGRNEEGSRANFPNSRQDLLARPPPERPTRDATRHARTLGMTCTDARRPFPPR
jgi:hypothetical protein